MARLNLTLDEDTFSSLDRHARKEKMSRATVAHRLIAEGPSGREALERQRKLAADYAAGREDARSLLRDLEAGQLDLMGPEDEEA